jgi:hypothetical protein
MVLLSEKTPCGTGTIFSAGGKKSCLRSNMFDFVEEEKSKLRLSQSIM